MTRPARGELLRSVQVPPPVGGLNTVDPASQLPPTDCLLAYNLLPADFGLRARLGYREHVTGMTGSLDNSVRSVLPFRGGSKSGATDKLFATTSTGIWDCTSSTAAPTQSLTFSSSAGEAGYGHACVLSNAGGRFLVYCDEANGMHVYTESGSWAAVTQGGGGSQISGVNPANLVFPCVWKNRLFLVERDTSKAWLGGVDSLYGAFTSFDFGLRMRAGGPLVGLYNWSYDAGGGLDTQLVAISSAGDVVIFGGTDPTDADLFGLRGTWTVGAVPYGRSIATDYGGDLLILSALGVVPISKLVAGGVVGSEQLYASRKVGTLIASLVATRRTLPGWGLYIHPTDNALLVTVPTNASEALEQLAMSFGSGGWTRYRDLPMYSAGVHNGELYFGTTDGRLCIHSGYVDNVTLADPGAFSPVDWSLFTAYSSLGNTHQKQVMDVRPILISETPSPVVEATARYDYDMAEPSAPSGSAIGADGTWDYSTWDSSVWGGELQVSDGAQGAAGMGRAVALAIRGRAISRTTLVGIDVQYLMGGLR